MRLFLMRWFHWPVELFEGTRNPENAQMVVMERRPDGNGFVLSHASLAIIGLTMPAGASAPLLQPELRATDEGIFCEFASATAALRAQQRRESAAGLDVSAEDVARAQRRSEALGAAHAAGMGSGGISPASPAPNAGGASARNGSTTQDGARAHAPPATLDVGAHASSAEASCDEQDDGAAERHRRHFLSKPRRPTLATLHRDDSEPSAARGFAFGRAERCASAEASSGVFGRMGTPILPLPAAASSSPGRTLFQQARRSSSDAAQGGGGSIARPRADANTIRISGSASLGA